jgi:histidinol-phosphatase
VPTERSPDLAAELALALELADVADRLAMSRFRASDLTVRYKRDGSPVTDADRLVEAALRERLTQLRPEHTVIGEEAGASGAGEWRWYLDPIDGTTSFAAGRPGWSILIALAKREDVIVGVASSPTLQRRWWAARGHGTFRNGDRMRVSTTPLLRDATVNDDSHGTLARGIGDHPLTRLARACGHVRPHRGHSFLAIAAGEGDVALGLGGEAWDYAPMKVILEEAGGRFTDLTGADTISAGNALVSNGSLHAAALQALR